MNIGSLTNNISPALQQHAAPVVQQPKNQSVDNDGDHDHGAPDGVRGKVIDIKA